MALIWKENSANQIEKGTVIFEAEEEVQHVCLILTGKVSINGMGVQVVLGTGNFLGVTDLFMGRYLSTYTALEDTIIYIFPAKNSNSIIEILKQQKDYRGIMVYTLAKYLTALLEAKDKLKSSAESSYKFLKDSEKFCQTEAKKSGILFPKIQELDKLQAYEEEVSIEQEKLSYYLDCADIPYDIVKSYFSYSVPMAQYHVKEISGLIAQILIECMEVFQYLYEVFSFLINDGSDQLFQREADLAIKLEREGKNAEDIIQRLDQTIDQINEIEQILTEYCGTEFPIDREQMEQIYTNVLIEGWIPFTEEDKKEEEKQLSKETKEQEKDWKEIEDEKWWESEEKNEQEPQKEEEKEIEGRNEWEIEKDEEQTEVEQEIKDKNETDELTENEEIDRKKLEQMLQEVSGAMQQILDCAGLEKDKEALLKADIEDLVTAADRQSQDGEMHQTKQEISSIFYDLYYAVFLYAQRRPLPLAAELFLNYGFLDERLLSQKQLEDLVKFNSQKDISEAPCCIYTMREWLQLIYDGEKEPSRNEFEEDYKDILRKQKRMGKITDRQEAELLRDKEKKVYFEINNMFNYNQRLLNGQLSTFAPVLYQEQMFRDMENLFLTKQKLNEAVCELLKIDYSVFYREVLYSHPEQGINKEYIAKQIMPDLILFPVVGNHVSMWQEITERRRDSAGRFLIPRFTEMTPFDLMIKLFGRFRWELCRTMQGSAWNDIKYKSLTSEYMDYLQFYKKNHDLSEEKKEKLKLQIQKGRNNSREVFLQDYEAWIKAEAIGAVRLNKVVRAIMAVYIPFAKPIREHLISQPLFGDVMGRYQREKAKRIRELETRFRELEKQQIELPQELIETMHFYKDL